MAIRYDGRTRVTLLIAGLTLLAAASLAGPARAQSLAYGEILGAVERESGEPVAGALVTLRDLDGRTIMAANTARDGSYRFPYLEPGRYQLFVEEVGYRPVRVPFLELQRGSEIPVELLLEPVRPPVGAPRVRHRVSTGPVGAAAAGRVDDAELRALPFRTREASDLLTEHTRATEESVEGLPLPALQLRLGGIGLPGPASGSIPGSALALPLDALAGAELRALPDVEFDAPAGVALGLDFPRGSGQGGEATVRAGRSDLVGSEAVSDATDVFTHAAYDARWDRGGGLFVGGGWRQWTPPASPTEALAATSAGVTESAGLHGTRLAPVTEVPARQSVDLFARLDVPTGRDGALRVQGFFSDRPGPDPHLWPSPIQPHVGGRGALLRVEHATRLRGRLGSETRAGVAYFDRAQAAEDLPATLVAPLAFGNDARVDRRWNGFASQTFHVVRDAHRLKAGASLDVLRIERSVSPTVEPAFRFADASAFAAARGFFASAEGDPIAEATLPRIAAFAQDLWSLSSTLRILVGGRLVVDPMPAGDIDLEERWYFATGTANTAVENPQIRVEPRLAIDWTGGTAGAVSIYAAAGLYHDRIDPRAVTELIGNDGSLRIRRAQGDLGGWPSPSAAAVSREGSGLTVPGTTFRPPRTLRVEAGLVHRFAAGRLGLEAVARRTDHLLRRSDANRRATPWGVDQYGRAIWTPLVQVDGLLGAGPDRVDLADFDHVWALEADASSNFYGATLFASFTGPGEIVLNGRYTVSRTRDDWPGLAGQAGSAPGPGLGNAELDDAWLDDVSDYDVPHHLLAEALLPLPVAAGAMVGVRYRLRSGTPFTPGYHAGIDYNGDGAAGDPAHIDPQLPGMTGLMGEWACLRDDAGAVASRNGCRTDPLHSLDAQALLALSGGRVTVMVEALRLLATRTGPLDTALYRLTPGGEVARSGAVVAIPLTVNPEFGSHLMETRSVPTLRLGLRVAF